MPSKEESRISVSRRSQEAYGLKTLFDIDPDRERNTEYKNDSSWAGNR